MILKTNLEKIYKINKNPKNYSYLISKISNDLNL